MAAFETCCSNVWTSVSALSVPRYFANAAGNLNVQLSNTMPYLHIHSTSSKFEKNCRVYICICRFRKPSCAIETNSNTLLTLCSRRWVCPGIRIQWIILRLRTRCKAARAFALFISALSNSAVTTGVSVNEQIPSTCK
jgi:hypothetical protein